MSSYDIFSSAINASFVNIENRDELTLGYRSNDEYVDSIISIIHDNKLTKYDKDLPLLTKS